MKAGLIGKIVVSSLIAIVLIGILIFGLNTRFGFEDFIDKAKDSGSAAEGGKSYSYTAPIEDVEGLNIQWVDGPIVLEFCEGEEIIITESCTEALRDEDKLKLDTSGDTVKVNWNGSSWKQWSGFMNKSKSLKVELPKKLKLSELEIGAASSSIDLSGIYVEDKISLNSTSGTIKAEDLRAPEISLSNISGDIDAKNLLTNQGKFQSVSGGIKIRDLTGKDVSANSVSGNVELMGNFEAINAGSVSGSITAITGILPEKTDLEAISGKISLSLPENDGFLLDDDSIVGDLTSSSFSIEKAGKQSYYKDSKAEARVDMSTTSGGMYLEKVEKAENFLSYNMWQEQEAAKLAEAKAKEEAKEKKKD